MQEDKYKIMKKIFKFSPNTNQWYANYKGMPINIDNDEYKKMSDDDVLQLIKNLTRQEAKKKTEDIMTPEEADEGFVNMRKQLGIPPYDPNKQGTFKKFIKGRLRDF
jgi:hypothetical protein